MIPGSFALRFALKPLRICIIFWPVCQTTASAPPPLICRRFYLIVMLMIKNILSPRYRYTYSGTAIPMTPSSRNLILRVSAIGRVCSIPQYPNIFAIRYSCNWHKFMGSSFRNSVDKMT